MVGTGRRLGDGKGWVNVRVLQGNVVELNVGHTMSSWSFFQYRERL